ncbi:MAG: patatin-like phospholipase family protein [Bacteroidota bacterium]
MKIGLALSGGGFRATVFHLGVLARLAAEKRLEEVTFLSTVSGGSLCIGMVHAINNGRWPESEAYVNQVVPKAHAFLTKENLQGKIIRRTLWPPWNILRARADILASVMEDTWGVTGKLSDLPDSPRWMINATCYESGKNWRFEGFRMGDYVFGQTYDTDFPLSRALAASAGFPGLIGALPVDTRNHSWFKYDKRRENAEASEAPEAQRRWKTRPITPKYSKVHLWDGGVYDNLGLEGLHDFIDGWRVDIDFLIVSDASGRSKTEGYRPGAKALKRIITGILMDQIRSLRSRAILERLINHEDPGAFLQIGNKCKDILRAARRSDEITEKCLSCLSAEEADIAANMETVIRRLSEEEFERLYRHGFEVADYTLYAFNADQFKYLGYVKPLRH